MKAAADYLLSVEIQMEGETITSGISESQIPK